MASKVIIVVLVLAFCTGTYAKEPTKTDKKTKTATEKSVTKEQNRNDPPVPGGARADYHLYQMWEDSIRHQKFPILSKGFDVSDEEKEKSIDDRKRYIFHMGTSDLVLSTLKYNEMDDGYYRVTHKSKELGTMVLVIQPKYRKCFDDVKKKFDEMQWVVLLNDRIDDPNGKGPSFAEIILETPRQCLGQLKTTGSKLSTAKGDFTSGN